MIRVASKVNFHSEQDAETYLSRALDVLSRFDLDPEAHDATLAQLVSILSAQHVELENVAVNGLGLLQR